MFPSVHLNVKFSLDGEIFDVEHFDINFEQSKDYKGQPQHEIGGGQMMIHISQIPSKNLYVWARKSTLRKDGHLLFQTDMGMTVLEVEFMNAYCVYLKRQINAQKGTDTILVIAPEIVKINGIEHDNNWPQ